jgi:hypothetical protein
LDRRGQLVDALGEFHVEVFCKRLHHLDGMNNWMPIAAAVITGQRLLEKCKYGHVVRQL